MRTIELWECNRCDENCISNVTKCHRSLNQTWTSIGTIQEQPKPAGPRLEDLKFGDEIEVKNSDDQPWDSGRFCGINDAKNAIAYIESEQESSYYLQWRLPLNDRIMRGQPIIWGRTFYALFSHFKENGDLVIIEGDDNGRELGDGKWRLPTNDEIIKAGHKNGRDENGNPWLTEG